MTTMAATDFMFHATALFLQRKRYTETSVQVTANPKVFGTQQTIYLFPSAEVINNLYTTTECPFRGRPTLYYRPQTFVIIYENFRYHGNRDGCGRF